MATFSGPEFDILPEWNLVGPIPVRWQALKAALNALNIVAGATSLRLLGCQIEDLAAGTDVGDGTAANARTIFIAPAALTISKLSIISQGTPAGINDSNTLVVKVYRGTNVIVTQTFNTATVFPANHTILDLGALANATFAAGEDLRIDVVGGATADPPSFVLQGEFAYV